MAGIRLNASQIVNALSQAKTKEQIAIRMLAQEGAKRFENYAKKNRVWTDRTGHARQRLVGYVESGAFTTKIVISQGVDYGIWLELANNMNYAICMPTVKAMSGEVLESFKTLFGEIL